MEWPNTSVVVVAVCGITLLQFIMEKQEDNNTVTQFQKVLGQQ